MKPLDKEQYQTERLQVIAYPQFVLTHSEQSLIQKIPTILSAEVTKSLPEGWQGIDSDAKATTWLQERTHEGWVFVIEFVPDNEVIGFLFLYSDFSVSRPDLRLGFLISGDYWGLGLGSELIRGLIVWCEERGIFGSITGGVEKLNKASIRVLEKNGFQLTLAEVEDMVFLKRVLRTRIEEAKALRDNEQFQASRECLEPLLNDAYFSTLAHLHIAWSYDMQGLEKEAVLHYKQALAGELEVQERLEALHGLASTLRCLGRYQEALTYFERASRDFPQAEEFKPFHAMCLYNLGRNKEAVSLLLNLLLETTNSESIKSYTRAIAHYARDLDAIW